MVVMVGTDKEDVIIGRRQESWSGMNVGGHYSIELTYHQVSITLG